MKRIDLETTAPLIFVCVWATGFIGARLGMPHSEPGTFLAIRFAAAFGLLALLCVVLKVAWPRGRDALHAIAIGVLIHGIYLGGVFWAIDRGMAAGVAAVIAGLQPLLTALLAGWLLGEKIDVKHWIGIGLGMAGVVMVVTPGLPKTGGGAGFATVAAAFLAMVSATFGTIYQKARGTNLDLRSGAALQYVGAFIPVFLLALFAETNEISWTWQMIVALIWSILPLSLGGIFLLLWLIAKGSVSKVSTLFFMVPAVAALMAYVLFGERLVALQIGGMVLCAIAVLLASGPGANAKAGQS